MSNNGQSYYEKNKEKILKQQQEQRRKKYEGLTEGYDYICCKECDFMSSELATHIINKHNMTVDEYKTKHNVDSVKSQKSKDRVKGSNNPAYQHGGKFSPFSDKFIYAETTDKDKLIDTVRQKKIDNNSDTTKIEYWLQKTDGDVEKAKILLSNRQSTFSLEKCIQKYGEEKGLERWAERQEKWLNSINNKSKEEIAEINKKKSNQLSFHSLWRNEGNKEGLFYILSIGDNKIKIGITIRSVKSRYGSLKYNLISQHKSDINHCFIIEQLLKKKLKSFGIQKKDSIKGFGWTETFESDCLPEILSFCEEHFNNKENTIKLFKENFNLKYADKFI